MAKFDVKATRTGDKLDIVMAGSIDEDSDFTQLSLAGASQIDVVMGGLKSINSCGIREWIKWMSTAPAAEITFNECPKIIVDQINMVDGFLPANAKVKSFFVPYYNDESGAEKNVLFRLGTEFTENSVNPPGEVKDDEGNPMEMDVIESKYFKFIKK